MVGGNAAAAMAATLLLATLLMASTALLTGAPPSSPPSRGNVSKHGLRSGWTKQQQQGLREMRGGEGRVGDGAYPCVLPRRQRSLAGEAAAGGVDARVVPPLASAKRQVPTGADPIHHNERPPSLPHRRRHFP